MAEQTVIDLMQKHPVDHAAVFPVQIRKILRMDRQILTVGPNPRKLRVQRILQRSEGQRQIVLVQVELRTAVIQDLPRDLLKF